MVSQTTEANAFISRILSAQRDYDSLNDVLHPSLEDEAELRRLYATDKSNTRLRDIHVGLVNVFEAPQDIRTTRARVVKTETDLSAKYVIPLSNTNRRLDGSPSMVGDIVEFKQNWSIFTEGSLSQLADWSNVVAAGGSVLACLTPLSESAQASKRSIRKFYHSIAYPASDVDLFLWGLTPVQAEAKINQIYGAVRDSVPWDVTCVRTKHTVSIHSQYPYRSVQIVLRLYSSPAEILAGFDVDAPCCAYDGQQVWASPRAIVAMMRQCNTVDMSRRSPSYEVRLAKYSSRGFEVYVPTLRRSDIDPTIYERSIRRIEGLARLLVLEKLTDTDTRYAFLESRRTLRGRPNPLNQYNRRKRTYKGDLKTGSIMDNLQLNDYDVTSLHIPYGPGWDARRIDKLVYQTDLGMNSTFNPKNKGRRLHRHPAFFGTMQECLEDCCEYCPSPIDDDEKKLQSEEDEMYIRGRISFIEEDPGRQSMSGSFNPIDVGEWSEQVYVGETAQFFSAIVANKQDVVNQMITAGVDVNRRDHVGRAPLHAAIIANAVDVAVLLVDAGARITARLVNGVTPLHLAARMGQLSVVRKLLQRSAVNAEKVKKDEEAEASEDDVPMTTSESERPSSEDDWSSDDHDDAKMNVDTGSEGKSGDGNDDKNMDEDDNQEAHQDKAEEDSDQEDGGEDGDDGNDSGSDGSDKDSNKASPTQGGAGGELPEDEEELPDIIEIDQAEWDYGFTALCLAVIYGTVPVIEELLTAGADPKFATKPQTHSDPTFHPLSLTILRDDQRAASEIAAKLFSAGASSSTAKDDLLTIFHRTVISGKTTLASNILKLDPNSKVVLNFPQYRWGDIIFPIVSAVAMSSYSMLAVLLAHGAKLEFEEDDLLYSQTISDQMNKYGNTMTMKEISRPLESAIAAHDYCVELLVAQGANCNVAPKYANGERTDPQERRSLLDWVTMAISTISGKLVVDTHNAPPEEATGWNGYISHHNYRLAQVSQTDRKREREQERRDLNKLNEYFCDIQHILLSKGAKTWNELYPGAPSTAQPRMEETEDVSSDPAPVRYAYLGSFYDHTPPKGQNPRYGELFEACYAGNNDKIEQLCLPAKDKKSETTPLRISVYIPNPTDRWAKTGYTPFFAAVAARKWDTARLILAIAKAQYKPKKAEEEKFNAKNIKIDDDDDDDDGEGEDEDDDSVASDETIGQDVYVDIAQRPSDIKCSTSPQDMFQESTTYHIDGSSSTTTSSLLIKAIQLNDMDMFMNLMRLFNSKIFSEDAEFESGAMDAIISADRPDMLDEFIRKTGLGIHIPTSHADHEDAVTNDANRVYLGLSVHGKKRKDLAKKNDPNASQDDETAPHPILWIACLRKAKGIIEYLAGNRPLEAYGYFCARNHNERAAKIRRTPDLTEILPIWLGWTVSPLGESPLTSAILGRDLDTVKLLFKKSPKVLKAALKESIKFLGLNPLMLALALGCDPSMIDFLLDKSISPAETDKINGWNIYHMVCAARQAAVCEHLLRKLPRDVSEALLGHQSKGPINTPLHLAVKSGAIAVVKILVEFSKATLNTRDIRGSTPLHSATEYGFVEITKILIGAGGRIIWQENGVGDIPLEITSRNKLASAISNYFHGQAYTKELYSSNVEEEPKPFDLDTMRREIPKLFSTIKELVHDGHLQEDSDLFKTLTAFAASMQTRLEKAIEAAEASDTATEDQNRSDECDHDQVHEAILQAISTTPGHREIVHLIDVQRSVHSDLEKHKAENLERLQSRDHDAFVDEEVEEEKGKGTLVSAHLESRLDIY